MTDVPAVRPLSPDYPFDQYQRYSDVRLLVQELARRLDRPSLRVLDVGGTELARDFLAAHTVLISNLIPAPATELQASGVELPFADAAFDVVITVDTLEHIPPGLRAAFVRELGRVAAEAVIITGPFDNGGINDEAERLLDDYLTNVLGQPYPFLSEHRAYGLPDVGSTTTGLRDKGLAVTAFPSGYTHRWLPLMLVRFALYQVQEGVDLAMALEGLYNRQAYWRDHATPSYRQVVVGARESTLLDGLERPFAHSDQNSRVDLGGVVALWQGLHATQALARRDRELAELRQRVTDLTALVHGYEAGRFMRLMRGVQTVRRRIGL